MWIDTFGAAASGASGGAADQPARLAAEGDGGDFLDARERDDDQRDQQHGAEAQREGGARHEVVAVPIGEHGGKPGADHIGAGRKQRGLVRASAVVMARIGSDSSTLTSSAMPASRQWSGSVIGPVQSNFGSRAASNRPQ